MEMTLDKFGRHINNAKRKWESLYLQENPNTGDKEYNAEYKQIKNLGDPAFLSDATNLNLILRYTLFSIYKYIHDNLCDSIPLEFGEFALTWFIQVNKFIVENKIDDIIDVYFNDINLNKLTDKIFTDN